MDVVHLLEAEGSGPLWGAATGDLNATLLAWPPGRSTPEHVNDALDVLLVVVAGGGTLELDGAAHPISAGDATIVERGARRRIEAGPQGIRYLTAHRRRGGLEIGRFDG